MLQQLQTNIQLFAVECSNQPFFGLPTWYKYVCGRDFVFPTDIPLVSLAILEIMLRIAGLVAVAYVVFGGVKYVVSQGDASKVSEAKGTIINGLAGLLIATFAVAMVSFLGNRVG